MMMVFFFRMNFVGKILNEISLVSSPLFGILRNTLAIIMRITKAHQQNIIIDVNVHLV